MVTVRHPAVAGLFYSADTQQLTESIEQLLRVAQAHKSIPKALIVPHAGYIFIRVRLQHPHMLPFILLLSVSGMSSCWVLHTGLQCAVWHCQV